MKVCMNSQLKGLKLKQIVWNFVQGLKTQQIFHLLTQNMIKAFKFRAQAIFILLKKTPLPPACFTKFEFEKFFFIILHYKYPKKLYT